MATYRSDSCDGHWDQYPRTITVGTDGDESHFNGGVFKVTAPHIFLAAGGSFVSIRPGQINLVCGGSMINITPSSIQVISPLIELNP